MTILWPWDNTPVKPSPNPCHKLCLGWDSSLCIWSTGHCSKHDNRYLVYFCHMRKGWHKCDLMRYYSSSAYINHVLLGCFGYISMLGSRWVSTTTDISSELNWSKPNKNRLFSPFLSWFDLSVTLSWPCYDIGVTPLWSPTLKPCHHV